MKSSSKPLEKLPPHVVLAKRMLKISEQSTGETILQAALLVIKIVNKVQGPKAPLTANPPVESNINSFDGQIDGPTPNSFRKAEP
jgi:hypothetical protein